VGKPGNIVSETKNNAVDAPDFRHTFSAHATSTSFAMS